MKKILIIEDNPTNLKLISDILVAHGYEILQSITGGEGLEISMKNYGDIGLILLDLKLPDIDGIEVIRGLKKSEKTRDIPVLVVSAHAMESDIKATKLAGCADYVTKPLNVREFLEKVNLILPTSLI